MRKFNRGFGLLLALIFTVLMFQGCGTRIEPGHVGIVVALSGKDRGVQDYTTQTGWVFYAPWSTSIMEYPTNMQTYSWTKNPNEGKPQDESITFTTKNGVTVNADVSLSYQLVAANVPAFYVKFRNDNLDQFTNGFLHNVSRDAFNEVGGKYTVEQVMGDNAEYLKEVRARVAEQVMPMGVSLQQFGFIGSPRPPQSVIDSINSSQQAQYIAQRKQNELIQFQADAAKEVAQAEGRAKASIAIANGEAESNRVRTASLTPQVIEWQKLAVQDRWINRWDGHMPHVNAGGSGTMLNIPIDK